jgi:SAM-dependent methyltransferase
MPDVSLEETRKERERAFHDQTFGGDGSRDATAKYYSVIEESRAQYHALSRTGARGARVLEYGCGPGSQAFDLARCGALVTGIDISPVAIDLARAEARDAGLAEHITFTVADAEDTGFAPGSFDVIVGSAILHHLDLRRAYAEIARLLAPGGRAVFIEPLGHNPLINAYRRATPKARTPDEHPLVRDDFVLGDAYFGKQSLWFYHLTSIAAAVFARTPLFAPLLAALGALDRALLRALPRLRPHAWMVVMELSEPRVVRVPTRIEPESRTAAVNER